MPIHKRVSYVVAASIALTLFSWEALAFDNGSLVEREIHAESLQHSKIGTPTLRKVESWRENKTRSAVLTPKNVGSSR